MPTGPPTGPPDTSRAKAGDRQSAHARLAEMNYYHYSPGPTWKHSSWLTKHPPTVPTASISRKMPLLVPRRRRRRHKLDPTAVPIFQIRPPSWRRTSTKKNHDPPSPNGARTFRGSSGAVLGLSVVLFAASMAIFKATVTKSLHVDRFTDDGHLRP
jgi:hypothetical protein